MELTRNPARKSEVVNDSYSAALGEVKPADSHMQSMLNNDDDSLTDNSVSSFPGDGITDGIPGSEQKLAPPREDNPSSCFSFKDFSEPLQLSTGFYIISMAFTPDDIVNCEIVERQLPLEIRPIELKLEAKIDIDLEFGMLLTRDMLELRLANGEVNGKYTFQPSSSVQSDDPFSDLIPVGQHSLDIAYEPEDALNYTIAKATVAIHVSQSDYTLETSETLSLQYGNKLCDSDFKAKCSKSYLIGTITFSISKSARSELLNICPCDILLPAGQ